nr:cell wall synthase accessory phosphoprotein MacP [Vagococcus proximus]
MLTRKEIRAMKAKDKKTAREKLQETEKELEVKQKKISKFFKRERKELKPVTKSRTEENEKVKERGSILNKLIIIVALLLVIMVLAIFYL